MKLVKKAYLFLLIPLFVLPLNSCFLAAVSIGDQTTNYIDGVYIMEMQGSYKDIYNASIETLGNKNNYKLVGSTNSGENALIEGITKTDPTDFYIKIEPTSKDTFLMTIKFGEFGDQAKSSTLMDKIQETLNRNIPNINYNEET
ncbi:DUF3568 family protein [Francisella sp. Scap27]|uniref:DUF3568 family protein n=1 Tax=Francisella sp. Scap27 TaxID=2589986 RepID=UPI0015BE63A2|nr:DUF3568 family protein [Francisella sp. Scap27]QLE79332.1 DUF3568 family protein [Francisella sp. Scap27]